MKKIYSLLILTIFSLTSVFANDVWNGIVHIGNNNQLDKHMVVLDGNWEFFPGQEFQSFNQEQNDMAYIKVPGSWKVQAKKNYQSDIACYRLKIVGLKPNTKYALFSRKCPATSSRFFCNGELIASYGTYSAKKEEAKPINIPVYAVMESDLIGSIELVVQISSYDSYESGIISSVVFAENKLIARHFVMLLLFGSLLAGAIIFTAIVNLSIYIGDRSLKIHCIFFFLLTGILCHLLCSNGNALCWAMPKIPYSVGKFLEYVSLWISPQLFCLIMISDPSYKSKFRVVDNILFAFFSMFGIIFLTFPIKYTCYIPPFLWFCNVIFYCYAIYRMARAFAFKQINIGVFLAFFVLIATGYFLDVLIPNLQANNTLLYSEIGIMILMSFDIFYMGFNHQQQYHDTQRGMNELAKVNNSFKKFISIDYLSMINDASSEMIVAGNHKKFDAVVMTLKLVVLCSDGRKLHPRDEFESCSSFMENICECIENNNGIFSGFVGMGCVAIFRNSSKDAIKCARDIIRQVSVLNKIKVNLGEACAMVSCGIHYGELYAGVVGETDQLSETIIGHGISMAAKIENICAKFGIPVLVSKSVIDRIPESELPCKMSLFQHSIISNEEGELYLYECHDEDYDSLFEMNNGTVPVPLSFKEVESN